MRPRVQIPGPRPKIVSRIERFASSAQPSVSHGRSQIFQEVAAAAPVQVDCGPSIELAHGYRTADMSVGARPRDREAPGFRIPSPLASTKPRRFNLNQLGELLTPEMAGSVLVDLVRADRATTAPGYLLTAAGLQKLT